MSSTKSDSRHATYAFTLFFEGMQPFSEGVLDALYDAGCDDAVFGVRDGVQLAEFERSASGSVEAITKAIKDVKTAVGARVVRIEPDELVTAAEIAKRSGLTREAVRLYAAGKRGPGGFPSPVSYPDRKTKLWQWIDVASWLNQNDKAKIAVDIDMANLIAAINSASELHRRRENLPDSAQKLIADLTLKPRRSKPSRKTTRNNKKPIAL